MNVFSSEKCPKELCILFYIFNFQFIGVYSSQMLLLGKNNDKNQVYPPNFEAFGAKQRIYLGKYYVKPGLPP